MFRTLSLYALAFAISTSLADCKNNSTSSSITGDHVQHMTLPFESRNQSGVVSVTIQTNDDAEHAFGLDLIYGVGPPDIVPEFSGFPVVHGFMTYPIPPSPYSGYGSLFGWVQFVKQDLPGAPGNWTMDVYPYAMDLPTPFAYWGYTPSVFDAPAIELDPNGNNSAVAWTAQAYLTELVDAGRTKNVTVVRGVAITWGFDIYVNESDPSQRQIVVRRGEKISEESEWTQRLPFLRETYTEWTFQDVE